MTNTDWPTEAQRAELEILALDDAGNPLSVHSEQVWAELALLEKRLARIEAEASRE